jgi:hypothetical protein
MTRVKFKKISLVFFFLLIILNLFFASWYVINKDIIFNADIARDFLLYREIDQKKIMLIGPRANGPNFFHGPIWAYINYPAYRLGKGSPVVVGWFWVMISALSLIPCFIVADKLFGKKTAYLYVLLMSVYLSFHARGMSHPHGALFLLPIYFFLIARYLQSNQLKYLIAHVISGGFLIQFEIAIGIPYMILSFLLVA